MISMADLRDAFQAKLNEGVTMEMAERAAKKVRDALTDEIEAFEWSIKDDLASNIAYYVQEMARNAVEALVAGDDDLMRDYLTCRKGGYNGRGSIQVNWDGTFWRAPAIERRAEIVGAHRDLLTDERIADVEAQMAALKVHRDKLARRVINLRQAISDALFSGDVVALSVALGEDKP